jgi:predicted nuclease with TOPRIM domain
MKGHIGMQIEITLSERLKHLLQDQETMSSQLKNLKEHLSQLDQSNKGRMDEYKKRLDGTLQKLKTEFTFK